MNWLPVLLGLMLGLGIVLAVQGLRAVADRTRPEEARRKGFWRLNAGLALVAVSVFAFGRTAQG